MNVSFARIVWSCVCNNSRTAKQIFMKCVTNTVKLNYHLTTATNTLHADLPTCVSSHICTVFIEAKNVSNKSEKNQFSRLMRVSVHPVIVEIRKQTALSSAKIITFGVFTLPNLLINYTTASLSCQNSNSGLHKSRHTVSIVSSDRPGRAKRLTNPTARLLCCHSGTSPHAAPKSNSTLSSRLKSTH